MKFWTLEVKPGQEQDVDLQGHNLFIRQASVGDVDGIVQDSVAVTMKVIVHGKMRPYSLVTLEPNSEPQKLLDWALERNFKVSHTLTNGSIHLFGNLCKRSFSDNYNTIHNSDYGYGLKIVTETQSPTVEQCLEVLKDCPDFQDESSICQAKRALQKDFVRQTFMDFENNTKRFKFLKVLMENDSPPI